ncbi:epoxide hydrolase N-terminal domain-containing protein, partial [Rhizobium leguminosarum]
MSARVETRTALSTTRRQLLAVTAATAALSILPKPVRAATEGDAIRPFKCAIPQEEVDELRRRVRATRWPGKETVSDRSQGAQLQKLKPLVEYWGKEYDWRRGEKKLNA